MADGLDEAGLIALAEQVGGDVSGAAYRDFRAASPRFAAVGHALGLAYAARVAERSMQVALAEKPEALEAFERMLATLRDRAETAVVIAELHENAKGAPAVG